MKPPPSRSPNDRPRRGRPEKSEQPASDAHDERPEIQQGHIQWYPGHIAKHERALGEKLKLVDVVVEVLDARMPETTTNRRLEAKIQGKPTVLVLNKSDIADPALTKRWQGHLKTRYAAVVLYDTKTNQHQKTLLQAIARAAEARIAQLVAKGLKRRPARVMVIGMPNVGKSSLINHLVGRKKTQTGHKAGVTRSHQWVRIHPDIELLDSPGIIPPALASEAAGNLLAVVCSVGEAAYDDELVARFLLQHLETIYPGLLHRYYDLDTARPVTLEAIAEARRFLGAGGEGDTLRAAQTLLSEFRNARLGRLSLESPGP